MAFVRNQDTRDSRAELSPITSNFAQITLESVAAALVVTDLDGRIRYMNLAATQMLARTVEQVRGQPWRDCLDLVDEHSRKPVSDPVRACLATGKTVQVGLYALLVDHRGAEIPVEGSVAPFCWLDDDVFGTVMMLRDVTASRTLMRRQLYPVI